MILSAGLMATTGFATATLSALLITDTGQQNAMSSGRPIDGLSQIKIYQDPYRVMPIHTDTHGSPLTSKPFEKSLSKELKMKTLEDLTDLILSV